MILDSDTGYSHRLGWYGFSQGVFVMIVFYVFWEFYLEDCFLTLMWIIVERGNLGSCDLFYFFCYIDCRA